MIASLTCTIVLSQIQVQGTKAPWHSIPMGQYPNSKWQDLRASTKLKIDYLKRDSLPNRKVKITTIFKQASEKGTPELIYILSACLSELASDVRGQAFMGSALAEISKAPGSRDPEFWRQAYLALCLHDAAYPGWKNLGHQIVTLFPKDMQLLEAYVWDSARGNGELDQIKYALNRFRSALKPILEKSRSVELECWLTLAMFARTRTDADYKEAKKYMIEYIEFIGDAKKSKLMRDRLTAYRKKWG